MQLQFLGATGTVTGSKYLLTVNGKRILIDCGLFQGYKELRERNWAPLPINPASIDVVILTHAHIDHSGYLPLLVKNGFKGTIYATHATRDLCEILLPDSAYLQEEEAFRANKYGYTKHKPALPLYTLADAKAALKLFKPVEFGKLYSLLNGAMMVSWHRAGHILGAAMVQIQAEDTRVVFSGDLGRPNDPVMKAPVTIQSADYLITESTYGNRLHAQVDPMDDIERIVKETAANGGSILIPAFAVGRAQNMLYYLSRLKAEGRIPDLPVFLDSPMAISVTKLMCQYSNEHHLTDKQCEQTCNLATYINTPEESKAIAANPMPKVIISASGMITGGRVLHHVAAMAGNYRNTILMTGYQAGGTRGARLLQGEKEVKIHGHMVPVKARIEYLTNTSAHADYNELLGWLRGFTNPLRKVFITHGEPQAAEGLKAQIETQLGWTCEIPAYLDEVAL